MFDVGLIQSLQSFSTPWLDRFFISVTHLGSHYAYMAILLFLYWAVDRRVARELTAVFLASLWFNQLLKEYLVMGRPDPVLVRAMVTEPSPGFPSGHAQGAMTLWGYMALAFRRRWFTAVAAALIVLIGVSRLYTGAHFPGDVLGGWALGAAFVAAYVWLARRGAGRNLSLRARLALIVAVPLLLYPLYQTGTSEQILGMFIGFFTAGVLAEDAVPFRERVPLAKQVAKLAIGFSGFAALLVLHMLYVPPGLPSLLGYSLLAAWVPLGAPALFRRWGLAGEESGSRAEPAARGRLRACLAAAGTVFALVAASSVYVREVVPAAAQPPVLEADRVVIIGHRGARGLAPENTLAAVATALEHGADWVELDVRRTRDGAMVAMHDPTVDRTTDGRGAVAEMTLEQIKALDAGYRFSPDGGRTYPWRGRGVTVPTLTEALAAFPSARFLIEIKEDEPGIAAAVLAAIDEAQARDRVMVASFHDRVVQEMRALAPEIPTGYGMGEALRLVIWQKVGLGAFVKPRAPVLQVPKRYGPLRIADAGLARVIGEKGMHMHVWTVNDPEDMRRVVGFGARGIVTDYPDRLQSVLEAMGKKTASSPFY
ncbi:MAG: phosphatase PAP2 family protein [Firmicutes bacterium]|nr:phosphatase PAP2 family protein [Bacillota bacterium]